MLSMSDTNIDSFLPYFAKTGVHVAFLVPTPTGYKKSIMDATAPVRELLLNSKIHNYTLQKQGPENKKVVQAYFVKSNSVKPTKASLYRPVTKHGDPRIWFYGLNGYCQPCNLLALVIIKGAIYVINLSDQQIAESLVNGGYVDDIVQESVRREKEIFEELLYKIYLIHEQGLLPSITPGDPGVGDTLEHALGIDRNNIKLPDYKGIELKAHRITRNGHVRVKTRQTLFSKVPDKGMTYHQILEKYGKYQVPGNKPDSKPRLQLYETFRVSRPNAYNLQLWVDYGSNELDIRYKNDRTEVGNGKYVSSWLVENLKTALLTKHPETFWIGAYSETDKSGREWFRYDTVEYTKNPNASLLVPLLEEDRITVDLAAHIDPNTGKYRDHGVLFKMDPKDLPLLFSDPVWYDFTKSSPDVGL